TATYTGELRQRLATYPDAEHEVSFWLRNRGGQPATMTVYWNDTVLATYQWGDTAYTYQSFTVTGTGDDTLKFAASSTPGDWRLDDVAVRGLREPGLQAMGYNGTGQLGLSDYANRRSATHVELDDVVSMAAGYEHSLALTTDGRLWACGSNGSGQLGLSGSGNRAVYTEVPLRNVRQVVAGAYHSAAVTADGTVWTWGSNEHGQLGLGHNANRDVPTVALYPSGSTLVAGYHHMMAVTEAGELYVCGRNSEGQLGLDHSSPVWTPTTLDLEAAISVWLGAYSSFAQTTDGRLWAWGANWNGRLGLGDWYQRNLPVDTGLSNIRFLAPGGSHALATVNSNRAPSATSQEVTTTAGAPVAVTLNGTDAETDPITFTLITSPSHGVLSGSAPNLIYSPEAGFSGTDAFMYRVSDPTGPGGTAIVWVVVGDRGPDAHDQDVVTGEGLAKAVTLTATDPDGDPLRFWIVDGPDHGTLTGAPPSVTYTPAAGYTGPDSFTFRASDAREESGTGTVSIRVNAIPVANPQTVSATSGIAKPITLTGSDGDGDSLTYSILTQPP
ncbi:MAG: hypothetical protein FJX72_21295, partial [Armatimonadetes bacterium]|nr:hypothetical protein [Armatimonadota bacterium]